MNNDSDFLTLKKFVKKYEKRKMIGKVKEMLTKIQILTMSKPTGGFEPPTFPLQRGCTNHCAMQALNLDEN